MTATGALADEHKLEPYYSDGSRRPAGLAWSHRLPDGRWCSVDIPLRGGERRSGWIVILDDPLTITPAMRCNRCSASAWLDGGSVRPR